jgi:tetratricopeptide (TPR) repeat protein
MSPDELAGEAWSAMSRRDWDEALRLWQQLRQDFPERPDGYVWPIQVFWQDGRLDEARAMAAEALARFPENLDVLVQHGWIATKGEHWADALRWWMRVRDRAPDRPDGHLWAIRALWQLARFDEAEAMATEASDRFPDNVDIAAERAWVAVHRGDWEAALARWTRLLAIEPNHLEAQARSIQAMRALGGFAEAETAVSKALARFPDDPDLLIERIWVAAGRLDWAVASSRLEAARERLQRIGRFESIRADVEARKQAALNRPGTQTADGSADEPSVAELMQAFESIGERCDLGAVQRRFGAEPQSLLRFAFAPFDGLIAALEDRFAAVGTAGDTRFESHEDETILTSVRYGMHFHTFVSKSERAVSILDGALKVWRLNTSEGLEAFREHHLERLISLKLKLIEDLETPRKIFAYSSDERTSADDAARLFRALRVYGRSTLLYIRPANRANPAGAVTRLRDGLYLGHYTGLTDFAASEQPNFDVWLQLLRRMFHLVKTRAEVGKAHS